MRRYNKSIAIGFDRVFTLHLSDVGLTGDVENRWNTFKDGFCKAAEATLKYQGENKKEWITEDTWASVEERSEIRQK